MKIFILLVAIVTSLSSFSQNVNQLELRKSELVYKMQKLEDSIKIISERIEKIKRDSIANHFSEKDVYTYTLREAAIKEIPKSYGNVKNKFYEKVRVKIVGLSDDYQYYEVCAKGVCGYIHEILIDKTDEVIGITEKLKKDIELKKQMAEEQRRAEEKRKNDSIMVVFEKRVQEQKKIDAEMIRKYGKSDLEAMKEGKFWIGMNKEQLIYSLGKPIDINTNVGSWGKHEQWVYGGGTYIYLENGIVTSYQQ
ncbi:hypothetical protein NE848_12830 [Gramella jeungdoensis]|uniref:Uncharacterized protein n=1 Tax=Gramella jeungdoensis TaxID=708091 RepID=A0ABT0Z3F9_9FLAO|nr:hypothetical protein [Gramella jeungdoensis]MCM8570271.1 hypothetical protein [Gramella jeungdoensis]